MLICKNMVNGYIDNGIVILEILEVLPHMKHRSEEFERWQELIHAAIENLVNKFEKPFFDRAHMGLMIEMKENPKFKAWDISNRAINFTINNLKGIFFPDDGVEYLSIISAGKWSDKSKTTILLGEVSTNFDAVNISLFEFLNDAPKRV